MTDHDTYRAIFVLCGLTAGRHFGSKSAYVREHRQSFFIANACIFTREKVCVWTGDLDLATNDDTRSLLLASRHLNRKLFVMREQTPTDLAFLPPHWLAKNAVVTCWRGQVALAGYHRRLYGTFERMLIRNV